MGCGMYLEATFVDDSSKPENLPSLVSRLGEDLTKLLDLRLNLLKVEVKEDVDAYVRRGVTFAIAAVIVGVGFALVNVALAFFISTLFANSELSQPAKYALGFIITGASYLIIGGGMLVITKISLAKQSLVPRRSLNEFENDKELVKSVIQG
jgi:uncharacterized membrane protein YqjE